MIFVIIFIILLILFIPGCSKYNTMVNKDEAVKAQWAQVENKYQRRSDLIENLVQTVKGYATHENKTLTEVTEARAKATSVNLNADKIDEASINKFQEAQDGLKSSLSKLMVVVEKYPDLKANTGFLQLQSQLETTEDAIVATRAMFNEIAKNYNAYIKRFPNNIVSSICGFKEKAYFTANAEANKVPKVKF
ncbi:MAG: LemA family protein [Bacteroidales bacterium]